MIAAPAPWLRVLECEVDTTRRMVARADGGSLRITIKAMQVLLALAERRGTVVSREALLERVWPDTMPTDDVVTQAVAQLRKAFGDDRDAPRYIETIAKAGYRLLPDVEWRHDSPVDASAPVAPSSPPPPSTSLAPSGSGSAPADGDHAASSPPPVPADALAGPASASRPARSSSPVPWLLLGLAFALLAALPFLLARRPVAGPMPAAVAEAPAGGMAQVSYRAITSTPGQERMPALSPDGTRVAFTQGGEEGEGGILMLQEVGAVATRVLVPPASGHSDVMPAWSPDGGRIAFVRVSSRDCAIMLVPASGGQAVQAAPCLRGAYSLYDWTPDGTALVMGGMRADGESSAPLQRLDLGTGRWQAMDYGIADGDVDLVPRHSPDGRWLAFRRNISLADLWLMPATGGAPRRLTTLRGDIRGWDWLPDGSGLVFSHVTSEASLYVYRLADGSIHPLPALPTGNAVHPDLAARAWQMVFEIDQSRSGVFRVRLDGTGEDTVPEPVFASSGVDMLPAISPDGRTLAFVSDRTLSVQLWLGDVDRPAALRAVDGLRPVPRHPPAWSLEGRTLLVLGKTGAGDRVFEVEAASGRVRALEIPGASPVFAAYGAQPGQLLVGVDGGQGRIRLVLYAREGWRELASVDDVAVARYDPVGGQVYFTRPSRVGLWRAGPMLADVALVSDAAPAPQHYRHWGVSGGRVYYSGPAGGCATTWQPLLDAPAEARCLARDGLAIAGSPSVDAAGRWLYLGLPMAQNIDIGWSALPRGLAQGPD
ncbi:winged helix-turn-helix domain-containing protein [Luteimonas kalidii]|uniref:Winged helix-turn-helix domain-containing protein n=1 Tax=Luteimonas kalidii TaxID=3042025 RepID=A0ABT6JUP3_9GAMM|nr:winged helix-turn-helix domain-containing protein [Luteimonas kalidii]MDH5834299.1 winged helix-turn-helix domain-containing protein [Luteimonas kalidii]